MKRTIRRILSLLLALASITALFAGCGDDEERSLYYPVADGFSSVDPQVASGDGAGIVASNCFEGLMRRDPDGAAVPAGADSYTVSPDGKTYTFKLRRDAVWYLTNTSKESLDTLPADLDVRVTAADYVFGLRRCVDPVTGSAGAKNLTAVKGAAEIIAGKASPDTLGVRAVDDFTLEITLIRPDPGLLQTLSSAYAAPCKQAFFEACRGRYGLALRYLLCNGPFLVWQLPDEKTFVEMRRNDRYTGAEKPKVYSVWLYDNSDQADVEDKLKDGKYDAGYVDSDHSAALRRKRGFTVTGVSGALWGFWFNAADPVFADRNMRLAFAVSVNVNDIAIPDDAEGKTSRLLLESDYPYFEFSPEKIAADDETAGKYFRAAVATNEDLDADLTLTVLTVPALEDTVKKQCQRWQRVFGTDVKTKTVEPADAFDELQYGDYQIAFLPCALGSLSDAELFSRFLSGSSGNPVSMNDKAYDGLFTAITDGMTDEQKLVAYQDCEQRILSEGYVVPVFTTATYFVCGRGVSGIEAVSPEEVYFLWGDIS